MRWWRRHAIGVRDRGVPPSGNGASSMHLGWVLPGGNDAVAASATLTVLEPPRVERLYFWALQAGFAGGAAHLGLQWHPSHPGRTAANFGGYRSGGGELAGSESPRPSARGNPNTRDYPWSPGRPYRLTIASAGNGWWSGLIDGIELRRLDGGGDRLHGLTVWSEVFARCDDPPVSVRWSDLEVTLAGGERVRPDTVRINYQSVAAGGCTNTTAFVDDHGVVQRTNAARVVPQGALSRLRAR